MDDNATTMTLLQLQQRIAGLITVPDTQQVWITAELSDVAVRGGHCYMELLEKHPDSGQILAKARGVVWANLWCRMEPYFRAATGQTLSTGLKVMVRVSASYHPVFGLSMVISNVNPEYTMGDLQRRRMEILRRLEKEGVIDLNRSLEWGRAPLRVAVVSAPGAAGYGDFINQLYSTASRFRFKCRLFAAVMQGDKAPASVMEALDCIAAQADEWDCVVVIRGGGASSDLAAFDNYDLAAAIAQFPLPVIVGIGHERDVTVLDYVASVRVKTPTAAAELLIGKCQDELNLLRRCSADMLQCVSDRLGGCRTQLAYAGGVLPTLAQGVLQRARSRMQNAALQLGSAGSARIGALGSRLDRYTDQLRTAVPNVVNARRVKLDNMESLVEVLSPMATLRRGYTITRVNGLAVTSVGQVPAGSRLTTIMADGRIESVTQ
ncbi:MAG: exodeoxyribonuclease VII large subunit [Muribaculaceae bacterium]|nr:exodeoxyribonuclease VII large subunit [Muribaculaceae bacterium]